MTDGPVLSAALALARHGFAVVPLHGLANGVCTCKKGDQCGRSSGKHPATRHGWQDAMLVEGGIRAAFTGAAPRNLGVACGAPSGGLVVLDVDPRNGGDATLRALLAKHGKFPHTACVASGGGGWHFWFRDTGGLVPRKVEVGAGLELLSTGNLVVCPPSTHLSGGAYTWKVKAPLADIPEWLARCGRPEARSVTSSGATRGLRLNTVIPLGSRNSELTRIAGMLVGRGAPEELVLTVLDQVNQNLCDPPMLQEELHTLVTSVLRYGPDIGREAFNDQGNARRLINLHGSRMRWLGTRNTWLVWNGQRWAPDNDEAMRLAKTVPDMLVALADQLAKPADPTGPDADLEHTSRRAKALREWGRASGSRGHLQAMLQLAASEPSVSVTEEDLDKHWWLLNTPGGVVDLRTGGMIPHAPEMMQTRMTSCAPKPGAAPTWQAFLKKVLAGDAGLARFLACAAGYSLTGSTQEHVIFLMWGEGRNGKTTFLEAVRNVLGDYALNTPFDTFTASGKEGPRNDIARLTGVRMTLATEGDEGSRLNEALIKRLTGGDVVTARYLYAEFFDFVPRFKIWLATNYRPRIRGMDYATWARIKLVPFEVTIQPHEKDPTLPAKLRAEYPQILHWLIQGAVAWGRAGLPACDKVDIATIAYRQDQDTIGAFLEECCIVGDVQVVPANDLYRSFHRWSLEQGENPWSNKVFKLRMEERGFKRARGSGGVAWRGLSLQAGAPDGRLAVVGGRAAR
jgi:putative DNA primase/helicase